MFDCPLKLASQLATELKSGLRLGNGIVRQFVGNDTSLIKCKVTHYKE